MMRKKGFTLIELLLVIAIIAVLVGMLIVAINPIRVLEDTRDTRNKSEMLQLKTALQLHFNELNTYPALPGALVPLYTKILPSVTTDPTFDYGSNGTDYDIGVDLNHPTTEDGTTVTKCENDGTDLADGNFMVCPD